MRHLNDPYTGTFGTLESFVDRVSEVLQCPVTLEDAHHQLIAYSRHDNQTDSARIETIIRRRVPEKVIYRLWKDGVIPKLLKSKEPLFIEKRTEIGLGARVAISIWRGEEVLGFIWVMEVNRRLNPDSLELLKKAATVAQSLLLNHQRKRNCLQEDSQELFWKLLTGHKLNERKIIDAAMNLKISLPVRFTVAVFRFKDQVSEALEHKVSYFLKTSEKVYVPFYTIEGKDIIILAGCADTYSERLENTHSQRLKVYKDFILMFRKNISEHLGIRHIDAGLGGIYSSYCNVAKSYQEAKAVIEVHIKFAGDTEDILEYQELGIYQFLDTLFVKRSQDGLDNIVIKKLTEYDQENNTQLIETLKTYLDKNENTHRTAAKLHIHVNTLSYRLKRITDITGIDLSKPNQKFMIYLDLKLLKWKKEL
ncbi:PucR family transcriptional regulator [bacterium LRH843]|nr:PucR family transcriptional regulator [bacterium LRH843]